MTDKYFDLKNKKVFVAGHNGMVGQAVIRSLKSESCKILTVSKSEIDLLNQSDVEKWIGFNKPDVVIICAAKVGGILANSNYPAEFIYNNLMIATNIIHASHKFNVMKLIFLGSSCIYPRLCKQPMTEDMLLSGHLEPTNEWYAIAKISGIKMCQAYRKQYNDDFISVMPTNLYGQGDNYNLETSHVIPALLKKIYLARQSNSADVEIWGTGNVRREFLHVDDCANGIIFLLKNYSGLDHVNLGFGKDLTIRQLAKTIMKVTGYDGTLRFETSKPDGMPVKLLDSSFINKLGWSPKIELEEGLRLALEDLKTQINNH
tara:strand:+ start:930 stop:1880 length:951 start_codon:yes stop_codon:yes gene_type:complete